MTVRLFYAQALTYKNVHMMPNTQSQQVPPPLKLKEKHPDFTQMVDVVKQQ